MQAAKKVHAVSRCCRSLSSPPKLFGFTEELRAVLQVRRHTTAAQFCRIDDMPSVEDGRPGAGEVDM